MLAGDGDDMRSLPLSMRKTNLARLLARRSDGIFIVPFEQGEIGPDLFRAACSMGLEGLVSKHRDRPYRAGRSPHWIKIKNPASPALSEAIVDALAAETRNHWAGDVGHLLNPSDDAELADLEQQTLKSTNARFGNEEADRAKIELTQAICESRAIPGSPQLASVLNLRDKHCLVHSLTTTRREKHASV
jgi:hypothetical protein